MGLKERLEQDLRDALRNRDEQRKGTLRLLLSAVNYAEIEKGRELEEGELLAVLSKQAKQRRESAAQFADGGRGDLVAQEEQELKIVEEYIPAQLSEEEIEVRARQVIQELGATSPSQMGEVMRVLMPQMKGKADGRLVNSVVTAILKETP
jgi:uncharacterized protein YqeY